MEGRILKGPRMELPEVNKSIGEFFFEQAEKFGDKVFQIDGDSGKEETFNDVKRRSSRVAIYLQKIGIKSGDKVLLCCLNDLDNIVPALAALYIGACISSVDHKQAVVEVKNALTLIEPKVILAEKGALVLIEKSVKEANQNPHIISIGDMSGKFKDMHELEQNSERVDEFRPIKVNDSDIAFISFTSGTTSIPKGICTSHRSLLLAGLSRRISRRSVATHFSSIIWSSTLSIVISCICNGSSRVLSPHIDAEKLFKFIEKYKITYVMCSIFHAYQITQLDEQIAKRYDTSSLYSMCVGGSTIDPQQILKLRKYLPHTRVNLGYGSTEMGGISFHNYTTNEKEAEEKYGSCGIVTPNVQIKFVDSQTGSLLGPNQKGEIRVKSIFMMAGYYKLSKPEVFDEDGFFKMEDIGYYDDDGYVYVTERVSDMFKYRSSYIAPGLLEGALLRHAAIAEAVVIGVPHVEESNHPAACVVLKPGATATPEELVKFCEPMLSEAYRLRGGVMIVESIPKTPSNKHQRRKAKEYFMERKGNYLKN